MINHSLSENFAAVVGANFEPMRQVELSQTIAQTHQKGNPNAVDVEATVISKIKDGWRCKKRSKQVRMECDGKNKIW